MLNGQRSGEENCNCRNPSNLKNDENATTAIRALSQWLVARGCNASVRERALKARTDRPTRKEFCDTICQKLSHRRAASGAPPSLPLRRRCIWKLLTSVRRFDDPQSTQTS